MRIAVSEAKAQLTELVRRAEAGDEIILTRHGHPAVRLVPVHSTAEAQRRRAVMEALRQEARDNPPPGPSAEHAADFLYDENGLPA